MTRFTALSFLIALSTSATASAQSSPPRAAVAPTPPVPPVAPAPPAPRIHFHERHGRDTPSHVEASASVKSPLTFRMHSLSADFRVTAGPAGRAAIHIYDGNVSSVKLVQRGDRLEVDLDGEPGGLRNGSVEIELPSSSGVEIHSVSGDIELRGTFGDLRLKSVSGDIRAENAANVEAKSVSGDVRIKRAWGSVRVKTVSGEAIVGMTGPSTQLEFESTSGNLEWQGVCAKGCRIDAASMSGDIRLGLDPKSSFELRYVSHSGDLRDSLGLTAGPSKRKPGSGNRTEARFGAGEGEIECNSFSGDLTLKKR